ncbi:hypothetical protein [Rheinheimera sp. EpRS3]|uniref:hypothetical protein n=1 Tax=Rheinheimera sp. EpRS3 TaxID=1712383 RepID=UPI000B1A4163|nr:hypothetical protein [Rheinheimera sp. EpRS3]
MKLRIADLKAIEDISNIYSNNSFNWDGIDFEISINWDEFKSILIESYDINGRFYTAIDGSLYKLVSPVDLISLPISVNTSSDLDITKVRRYLHRYLMDLFLICNLSAPGIIDFYNAKLDGDDKNNPIKASSFSFGYALENLSQKRVPYVFYSDVKHVKAWFETLNIGMKMTANSSVEKAMFSLLHIVKMDGYDIGTIPWIFHALEAIYGTNAGRGFNDLSKKINFLLSVEERQQKALKTQLRELNDMRSKFVHGGFNVSHPMDYDLNEQVNELVNFGVSLVISSIQNLMLNDWDEIGVEENIYGHKATAS